MPIKVNIPFLKNIPKASQAGIEAAGLAVLNTAVEQLHTSGAYLDIFWAPRKSNKRSHQLLIDTGDLLRSLIYRGIDNVFIVQDENNVTVGSSVKYAAVQNFGSETKRIPARTFLTANNERVVEDATKAYKQSFLENLI